MICVKLLSIFSIICLLFAKLEGQQQAYGGGGYSASGVASNAGSGYESAASGPKPAPPPPQPAPAPAQAYPSQPAPAPAQAYPPQPVPSPPSRPASAPTETGYGAAQPEAPKSKTHGTGNLGFPLPSCYVNADGFMCCNKELENLMSNTYRNISQSRGGKWKKCNIHQVAVATQRNAEKHFGVDFELVVGAGDYASKNYFNQDLNHFGICNSDLRLKPMILDSLK